MHIETLGHGPDLVLLHGWAMHSGIFAPLVRELAPRFRLHLVDLPGHGLSRDDAAATAAFDLADAAHRIAAATPPALWIGWSLGGLVGLHGALHDEAKVRGVCLIATNPRFVEGVDWPHGVAPTVFGDFAQGLRDDYRRTVERFLALEAMGSDHAQSELRELKAHVFDRGEPALHVLCEGLDILDRADLRAELPKLGVPSLWIAGRRDRLVPLGAMAWAAQQAPRARYLEFSAGHAPFLGHAAEIAEAITAFHAEFIDKAVSA